MLRLALGPTRWLTAAAVFVTIGLAPASQAEPEERYTVETQIPEMAVASQDTFTFTVKSSGDYRIDADYDAELVFMPEVDDEVLVAAKSHHGPKDASYGDDGRSQSWSVPVTAKRRGRHPVKLSMRFRVCDGDDCHIGRYQTRFHVVVKD